MLHPSREICPTTSRLTGDDSSARACASCFGRWVNAVQPLERAAKELGAMDSALSPPRRWPPMTFLRPPGALPEPQFRDMCSRCGACVKVCPAQCIKLDAGGVVAGGVPYIEPEIMPCVVCEGLRCMHECPTGALAPLLLSEIRMGTAIWHQHTCLRSQAQPCTICIDQCPLGAAAIELLHGKIRVITEGCIGCGVCQHACPTSPKSIVVLPPMENSTRT